MLNIHLINQLLSSQRTGLVKEAATLLLSARPQDQDSARDQLGHLLKGIKDLTPGVTLRELLGPISADLDLGELVVATLLKATGKIARKKKLILRANPLVLCADLGELSALNDLTLTQIKPADLKTLELLGGFIERAPKIKSARLDHVNYELYELIVADPDLYMLCGEPDEERAYHVTLGEKIHQLLHSWDQDLITQGVELSLSMEGFEDGMRDVVGHLLVGSDLVNLVPGPPIKRLTHLRINHDENNRLAFTMLIALMMTTGEWRAQKTLYLNPWQNLAELGVLYDLSHIEHLILSHLDPDDLSELDEITHIEDVTLINLGPRALETLGDLNHVRRLTLRGIHDDDWSELGALLSLEELTVDRIQSSSWDALNQLMERLEQLRTLKVLSLTPQALSTLSKYPTLLAKIELGLTARPKPQCRAVARQTLHDLELSQELRSRLMRVGERILNTHRHDIHNAALKMMYCPAGEFRMGSTQASDTQLNKPPHYVRISRPFLMAQTPVTQRLWSTVLSSGFLQGDEMSHFDRVSSLTDDHPIRGIFWIDAVRFCNALSELEGLTLAYRLVGEGDTIEVHINSDSDGYRLPTEAEWEYAARAGMTYNYSGSEKISEVGWHRANSKEASHPVARKLPNAWGLYDLSGNIMEYCVDKWLSTIYERRINIAVDPLHYSPSAKHSLNHACRGGGYDMSSRRCRVTYRHHTAKPIGGIRLVRTLIRSGDAL